MLSSRGISISYCTTTSNYFRLSLPFYLNDAHVKSQHWSVGFRIVALSFRLSNMWESLNVEANGKCPKVGKFIVNQFEVVCFARTSQDNTIHLLWDLAQMWSICFVRNIRWLLECEAVRCLGTSENLKGLEGAGNFRALKTATEFCQGEKIGSGVKATRRWGEDKEAERRSWLMQIMRRGLLELFAWMIWAQIWRAYTIRFGYGVFMLSCLFRLAG